jgi:hypothetical protein
MRIILIAILLFICLKSFAPGAKQFFVESAEKTKPYERIWELICKIESNNDSLAFCIDINNLPSVGIAQIQESRLQDYNNRSGDSLTMDDMFHPAKAKKVFMWYCEGDYEHIAKSWNGSGKMTEIYWQKILRVL